MYIIYIYICICGIIWPWLNIEVLHFDHRFGGAGKTANVTPYGRWKSFGKICGLTGIKMLGKICWFTQFNILNTLAQHRRAPKGTGTGSHLACGGWARNGSRFCIANFNSTIADGATPPVIQAGNGQNVYVFDCMSYVQKNIGGQIAV